MSCLETYATLRVISKSVPPSAIESILGIKATKSLPVEPDSKYRHRREQHYWGWSSHSQMSSTDGLQHVHAIIALLQGKEQELSDLRRQGCEVDILCYWVSSGQGGPTLDPPALSALAHLGLPISWDMYFGEASEYEEGSATSSDQKN